MLMRIYVPFSSIINYLLISIAFLSITAAGNVHNDLCDVVSDRLNKPDHQVIGHAISTFSGWKILIALFTVGFISILVLSISFSRFIFLGYYLGFAILLYLYNVRLKCIPLLGNIVVAAMCGCVVLTPLFLGCNETVLIMSETQALRYLKGFAILAFAINLIREIVKDLQDIEGDATAGCQTFPVAFSVTKSHMLIYLISICFAATLFGLSLIYLNEVDSSLKVISAMCVTIPFICFLYYFIVPRKYDSAQGWLKIVLMAGLVVLLLLSNQ